MPRACIRNARFLATADSPLLPFLAPRAFAEAPLQRTSRTRDDGRTQKESEKEDSRRFNSMLVTGKRLLAQDTISREASHFGRPNRRGKSGGLPLVSSSPAVRPTALQASATLNALDQYYADISFLTRQQLRGYSTQEWDGHVKKTTVSAPRRSRRTVSKIGERRKNIDRATKRRQLDDSPRRSGSNSKSKAYTTFRNHVFARRFHGLQRNTKSKIETRNLKGNIRIVISDIPTEPARAYLTGRSDHTSRKEPIRPQSKGALESRRRKILLTQRRRMDTFLEYEKSRDVEKLMRHGRYRSLQRRIFNFARQKPMIIKVVYHRRKPNFRSMLLRAFIALDRRVYPGIRRRTLDFRLRHDPQCVSLVKMLLQNTETEGESQMWKNWMEFDPREREMCWPYLLLYFLDRMPTRASHFLQILAHGSSVENISPEILADALGYLARIHLGNLRINADRGPGRGWSKLQFVPIFTHIFRNHLAMYQRICSQDLFVSIAKMALLEDVKIVFDLLAETNAYLLYNTWLHFANRFALAGEHEYAIRCLRIIRQKTPNSAVRQGIFSSQKLQWTCALILRKSTSNGGNYHETTGIVAALVELGVKLDVLLHNVIISNAMEAGDYATAFQVYNTLDDNGLKPDKYTFSTLLHGCTRAGDPARFHDFAEYCAQMAKELKDPWLAEQYLFYIHARYHRDDWQSQQDLTIISQAYAQLFSTKALELFWNRTRTLEALAGRHTSIDEFTPMEPSPVALYIMLELEIRNASTTSTNHALQLYLKFKRLIREHHDSVLTKLGGQPIIWNAFLLAFCRKQQFANASQLIKDMCDNSPQPNIYTWNIFMKAFFNTGQVEAAERVFEILRSRGVHPDKFTYDVLLKGYAKAQQIEKIGETMEHVNDEQQLDPTLVRALARVHNRRRMMIALEKSRLNKERKLRKIEEEKAARDAERWKLPSFEPMPDATPEAGDAERQKPPSFEPMLHATPQAGDTPRFIPLTP